MTSVEFCGEQFDLSSSVGLMPLLKFAKAAKSGADTADLDGLVAMYEMLEQCFTPEAWQRFQQVATDQRVDAETLLAVIPKAIEAISSRPTGRLSDSSAGQPTTSPSSAVGFSEAESFHPGRPDMAMGILRSVG